MAIMVSKYAGKCKTCRSAYSVGADIFWSRVTGALCLACRPDAAPRLTYPAPAATPGPYVPSTTVTGPFNVPAQSGEGNHSVRIWQTFAEYVECAKSAPRKYGEMSSCWEYGRKKFTFTDSWDEMVALAENGWDEVRPTVDALVEKIDADIAPRLQPAFQSYFDVSGGMVDVGRFLDGEPECMVETRLVEIAKPGRVVTLLISGGVMAGVDTASIIERGCAIVALVDSLEKMQHGCEIWLEMSCAKNRDATPKTAPVLTHLVKLKSAEDAMDVDMLMFAIAHPARHRRMTFALRRNEPNMHAFDIPHEATVALTQAERVGASLVLESLSHGGKDVTGKKWIQETLAEFGLVKEEG